MMRRVLIESPFAAPTEEQIQEHLRYARTALRDALYRNEAPLASHLLYTQQQVTDDTIPEQRQMGIDAGLAWHRLGQGSRVYTDCGISKGMIYGIKRAKIEKLPVEYRTICGWTSEIIKADALPAHHYSRPTPKIKKEHLTTPCYVLSTPVALAWQENAADVTFSCACMIDSLEKTEAPLPFHMLYTLPDVLDLENPGEKTLMLDAKKAWLENCDGLLVYTDQGVTPEMERDIEEAFRLKKPITFRTLTHPRAVAHMKH